MLTSRPLPAARMWCWTIFLLFKAVWIPCHPSDPTAKSSRVFHGFAAMEEKCKLADNPKWGPWKMRRDQGSYLRRWDLLWEALVSMTLLMGFIWEIPHWQDDNVEWFNSFVLEMNLFFIDISSNFGNIWPWLTSIGRSKWTLFLLPNVCPEFAPPKWYPDLSQSYFMVDSARLRLFPPCISYCLQWMKGHGGRRCEKRCKYQHSRLPRGPLRPAWDI